MSLEHATQFVKRLREDPEFRWALGDCKDAFERRRFVAGNGFRFSPAELACATSPAAEPCAERLGRIERARRAQGHASFAFM
jgi:predicted ribosomally synthesized peptide with nif11-like leader